MNQPSRSLLALVTLMIVVSCASAEEIICRYCAEAHRQTGAPLGVYSDDRYQYAPVRQVDVQHIRLDVTPDFKTRTVVGTVSISATPISQALNTLRLDAIDLNISKVRCIGAEVADYVSSRTDLQIAMAKPVAVGTQFTVHIDYTAEPTAGLYFRTPEQGYPAPDTHIWTQGESHEARHWFPCFDYPNERSSTEVICHVPQGMTVLSNGQRVGEDIDDEGLKVVHWLQKQPQPTYLICLVAGNFKSLWKQHGRVPLGFHTQPTLFEHAANSFRDTPEIMAFYEKEIGLPFPWPKYDQVTIRDFVAGGMENTSLTTLTHNTIFADATENIRSTRRLDAHEMAHQWFGDYVTCKDWSHLWLNEGFATYYTHLYEGHKFGRDAMLYGLFLDATRRVLTQKNDKRPIVYRGYKNAGEQFDYRAYPKGSWVLHMLRCQLGENLYRQCIKAYLEKHALDSVVSEDLRKIIEQYSGRPMDRFFDQWVYHPRHPDLKISYKWMANEKLAKVTVEQTQKLDDDVLLYRFPTKVRFIVAGNVVDKAIEVKQEKEDFFVPLSAQPTIVRFDPDYTVLADVSFDKSNELLKAQIQNTDDMIGRLLACQQLAGRKTQQSRALLEEVVNNDIFYGVRLAAADALAKHESDEAMEFLQRCWNMQRDARVRLAIVERITGRYEEHVPALIKEIVDTERNPAIQAAAIKALGRFSSVDSRAQIMKHLSSDSFRNEIASAAIAAIRQQGDDTYAEPLMNVLVEREQAFTSSDFGRALQALANVAHSSEVKSNVREFLASYVNHPKTSVRTATLLALGDLGDRRARPILASFSDSSNERVSKAAKQALNKLDETGPVVPREVVELRKAVTKMEQESKTFKDDLNSLRKRLDDSQVRQ